eukprot:72832-Chlamydomonas_euryale.AAC.8
MPSGAAGACAPPRRVEGTWHGSRTSATLTPWMRSRAPARQAGARGRALSGRPVVLVPAVEPYLSSAHWGREPCLPHGEQQRIGFPAGGGVRRAASAAIVRFRRWPNARRKAAEMRTREGCGVQRRCACVRAAWLPSHCACVVPAQRVNPRGRFFGGSPSTFAGAALHARRRGAAEAKVMKNDAAPGPQPTAYVAAAAAPDHHARAIKTAGPVFFGGFMLALVAVLGIQKLFPRWASRVDRLRWLLTMLLAAAWEGTRLRARRRLCCVVPPEWVGRPHACSCAWIANRVTQEGGSFA